MNMLESVISIFAPHNCICCGHEGALLCHDCWPRLGNPISGQCYRCRRSTDQYSVCAECQTISSLDNIYIRTKYHRVSKELIHRLKFQRAKAAADVIAQAMSEMLKQQFPDDYKPVVVPVPTASSRRRQRGYDQAVLIARGIAGQLELDYSPLLVRVGQSRQVGTDRTERQNQMSDAFRVRNTHRVGSRPILLVDDVLTTGATLEAATRVLKDKGVKDIYAVVFARA